jgi:hypothetical protein
MIKQLTILLIICSLFGCKQSDNERSKIYYSLEGIPNNDKFGWYHSLDKLPRNPKKVKTLWVEIKSKDQLYGFEKLVNLCNLDVIIQDQDILNELIIKASKLKNLTSLSLSIYGVDSVCESLGKLTQLKDLGIPSSE